MKIRKNILKARYKDVEEEIFMYKHFGADTVGKSIEI